MVQKKKKKIGDKEKMAVIDLGSNAARLAIFDGCNRAPVMVYAERDFLGLGKGLAETGKLNPDGARRAMDSLARFAALIRAMKIRHVEAVATAAVRDAKDGAAFLRKVKNKCGLSIHVIEGGEEARLSALGVTGGGLCQNGIIGDLGGGSLELIEIENGKIKNRISLPLGTQRIMAEKGVAAQVKLIAQHLDGVSFLKNGGGKGREFCALGGAWRTLARLHIKVEQWPVPVIDHHKIEGGAALEFVGDISKRKQQALMHLSGMTQKKIADIPAAALLLSQILERMKPQSLTFSATGLREGLVFDRLDAKIMKKDPLFVSAFKMAGRSSRYKGADTFLTLARWIEPLFDKREETPFLARVRLAAALMSDTGWFEHESVRGEHALTRVLTMPYYDADHATRAMMALACYVRYHGEPEDGDITAPLQAMLGNDRARQAVVIGLALNLAYMLTGGALDLLRPVTFKTTPDRVELRISKKLGVLKGEAVMRILSALAVQNKRTAVITEF